MGTISKNFSYSEFEASETATRLGIDNHITTFAVRDAVKNLVVNLLQPIRDIYKQPMPINSGYRCYRLNKAVGGVASSQHCKGEAADIGIGTTKKVYNFAKKVKESRIPFDQMILYPTFVHLSLKLNGQQRKQILYNKTYKGNRL